MSAALRGHEGRGSMLKRWLLRLRGLAALSTLDMRPLRPKPVALAGAIGDASGGWTAIDDDPQLLLQFSSRLPRGLCSVRLQVRHAEQLVQPRFYFDCGTGFSQERSIGWTLRTGQSFRAQIYIPLSISRVRFDPCEAGGGFKVDCLEFSSAGLFATVGYVLRERLRSLLAGHSWSSWLNRWLHLKSDLDYAQFLTQIEPELEMVRPAVLAHIGRLGTRPLISVLMPTWNTPGALLDSTIESVLAQVYPHWELCIVDDGSDDAGLPPRLRRWAQREPRIRLVIEPRNAGISAASNRALELAQGEWVCFLDHDDELAPLALYHLAAEIDRDPALEMIYTDEDKIDANGNRFQPHLKPAWNPELLEAQNYITHLVAYRRERVRALGGLRSVCDGSQDHDLALRLSAGIEPRSIRHVPVILYHWRCLPGSTALSRTEKSYPHQAGLRALRDHVASEPGVQVYDGRLPLTYRVTRPLPEPIPKVTVIVPTRDGYQHLRRCVQSLMEKTKYANFELLIVDNQSQDTQTLEWLEQQRADPRIRVVAYDAPFNFSAINNFAVRQTDAPVLVLLNDDTEVIAPDWLTEMVSLVVRPDVGAVGAKLYYPDERIQHAGVALGIGGVAGHIHWRFPADSSGYMGRLHLRQAVGAVTAACLAVSRDKFLAVGGLDEEELKVAFNDVDLCLKLAQRGWRCIWTPYAELYHHESISRGAEDSPEKIARFGREIDCMRRRWEPQLDNDPYYHRCFSRTAQDYSLNPAPQPYRPWESAW